VLVGITIFAAESDDGSTMLARDLIRDFRWVVISVVGFYFANEAVASFIHAWVPGDRNRDRGEDDDS
jgi:hypothetical protein